MFPIALGYKRLARLFEESFGFRVIHAPLVVLARRSPIGVALLFAGSDQSLSDRFIVFAHLHLTAFDVFAHRGPGPAKQQRIHTYRENQSHHSQLHSCSPLLYIPKSWSYSIGRMLRRLNSMTGR